MQQLEFVKLKPGVQLRMTQGNEFNLVLKINFVKFSNGRNLVQNIQNFTLFVKSTVEFKDFDKIEYVCF
jgi:hypothetical protein